MGGTNRQVMMDSILSLVATRRPFPIPNEEWKSLPPQLNLLVRRGRKVRIFQNEHNDPTASQLRQHNRHPSRNVELRRVHNPLPSGPSPVPTSSITTVTFPKPPTLTSNVWINLLTAIPSSLDPSSRMSQNEPALQIE
jgi:hypothetical protein